jgi:beta-lactamase regulating signal transducer with metallopeptidase domain
MISDVVVRLLAETSLRAALVLALAAGAAWSLRRAPAELRHALWKAGLLAVLLLPLGFVLMPRWKLPILPASESPPIAAAPAEIYAATGARIDGWIEPLRLPRARFPWTSLIALAWLAGSSLLLIREVGCRRRLSRLLREAEPVSDPRLGLALREAARRAGYRAAFDCLVSAELRVPLACGVTRPTVLLPERARGWSPSVLSDVLVHEMSHLRRGDPLWLWAARIGRALYWFHPLVWLATRRMLAESERACDDAVMRGGERPSCYAETLLFVASAPVSDEQSPALAFVRRHGLERRIADVLAQGRNLRPLGRRGRGLLAVLALGIGTASAVAHPIATCAGASESAAATPLAEEAKPWRAGGPPRAGSAYVCNENKSPLRLRSATVQRTLGAGGETQVSRPRIAFENQGRRAITAVQLSLELPTTNDRMWQEVSVAPGASGEIELAPGEWAAVVPAADASRLVIAVAGLRFANGDSWHGKDTVTFPDQESKPAARKSGASRIDARDAWVFPLEADSR